MNVDLKTGVISLILLALAFATIRWAARGAAIRGRKETALQDLYASFAFKIPVNLDTFVEVLSIVGKCYHIPPGKLRASDRFGGNLSDIDSWDLGGGAEDLERALEQRSIPLPKEGQLSTVQDLIEYYVTVRTQFRGEGNGGCANKLAEDGQRKNSKNSRET